MRKQKIPSIKKKVQKNRFFFSCYTAKKDRATATKNEKEEETNKQKRKH